MAVSEQKSGKRTSRTTLSGIKNEHRRFPISVQLFALTKHGTDDNGPGAKSRTAQFSHFPLLLAEEYGILFSANRVSL